MAGGTSSTHRSPGWLGAILRGAVGRGRRAQEQFQRGARSDPFVRAQCRAGRRAGDAPRRAWLPTDRRPPKGMSVDSATRTPASSSDARRQQPVVFFRRDVRQVLVAAFGHEIGLGDHQDTQLDEVGQAVVGDHRGMLDAIVGVAARGPQCGDGDDRAGPR